MVEAAPRRLGLGFWGFIVLMLALTALFVGLGVWQVERLQWKEGLIAEVEARFTQPPVDLPPVSQWPSLSTDDWSYRPVRVTGHYLTQSQGLVFTSVSEPKGAAGGAGYWLMAPFAVDGGGTVFVNRGFIPQARAAEFLGGQGLSAAPATIEGIAVAPESAGPFTPSPETSSRIEWVRDPARLAALAGTPPPVLGFTIDLPSAGPGVLPQGGATLIDFPNNHLGYAFTWFGFALLTPALLGYWIWRQTHPTAPDSRP